MLGCVECGKYDARNAPAPPRRARFPNAGAAVNKFRPVAPVIALGAPGPTALRSGQSVSGCSGNSSGSARCVIGPAAWATDVGASDPLFAAKLLQHGCSTVVSQNATQPASNQAPRCHRRPVASMLVWFACVLRLFISAVSSFGQSEADTRGAGQAHFDLDQARKTLLPKRRGYHDCGRSAWSLLIAADSRGLLQLALSGSSLARSS